MRKLKPAPLHPTVFYDGWGHPSDGKADEKNPNVVIPLETCVFATHSGPMLLRKGVPQTVYDAHTRQEMRECGVIA